MRHLVSCAGSWTCRFERGSTWLCCTAPTNQVETKHASFCYQSQSQYHHHHHRSTTMSKYLGRDLSILHLVSVYLTCTERQTNRFPSRQTCVLPFNHAVNHHPRSITRTMYMSPNVSLLLILLGQTQHQQAATRKAASASFRNTAAVQSVQPTVQPISTSKQSPHLGWLHSFVRHHRDSFVHPQLVALVHMPILPE